MRATVRILALTALASLAPPTSPALAQDRQDPLVRDYVAQAVTAPPASLGLDPFYRKYVDAQGIPIVTSEQVPDAALLVARDIVTFMLMKRPDIREEMIRRGRRVALMAQTEYTMDIPEYRAHRTIPAYDDRRLTASERARYHEPGGIGSLTAAEYWNRRGRGFGGSDVELTTSGAEENVLGYPGTRYYGEHILIHEFSHGMMNAGIRTADPALYEAVQQAYRDAMAAGKYGGHYASNNAGEYWAEGVQWYVWSNYPWTDGDTRVWTPDEFRAYDPTLFALIGRVLPDQRVPGDVYHGVDRRAESRGRPEGEPQRPLVEDYVRSTIAPPPAELGLDPFYRKYVDANGIPIVTSEKVPDAALLVARDQVAFMLAQRPDIRQAMIDRHRRLAIMAETEYTLDIPEYRAHRTIPAYDDPRLTPAERARYHEAGGIGTLTAAEYWNRRGRGFGGSEAEQTTSCAEENLLGYPGTRYFGVNICVHEFSHGIMNAGIRHADPALHQAILDAYASASAAGLETARGYAGNTAGEYWATGVEWFVFANRKDPARLREVDPTLYALIASVIPANRVPMDPYHARVVR